jgi:hypothetical protein
MTFSKYMSSKIKEFLLLVSRPKDIKKVLIEGNGRENKKIGANPYYSPLTILIHKYILFTKKT